MLRRALALVLLVAPVAACSGGDGDGERPHRTVAILRAVTNRAEPTRAFLDVLAEAGWVEGETLTVLGGDPGETHADDAAATVRRWAEDGTDLVVALSSSGAMAADEAAPDVPVLFLSTDPTAVGLVADERAPEGHLTGATFRVPADRTLDVAVRALGGPDVFGLLWPADDPAAAPALEDVGAAGAALGVDVVDEPFTGPDDVPRAVAALVGAGIDAVLLANAPSTVRAFDALEAVLAEARLPVVANTTNELAVVTLQPDTDELYRQLGRQAVRLLGGRPVGDVPVEDPAAYRLVIDRAAAAALGIEVPQEVLDLADEVVG